MTSATFYPFPHCPGCIQFSLEPAGEDGQAIRGGQSLDLSDGEGRTLVVSAFAPIELVLPFLPPGEQEDPPVECLLVGRSMADRIRTAWSLEGEPLVRRSIRFEPGEWGRHLDLQVVMVRAVDSAEEAPGLARHRGAALAWSDPVRLVFEDTPAEGSAHLEVVWDRFGGHPESGTRPGDSALLALEPGDGAPWLRLNADFPGFADLLEAGGNRGIGARSRDVVNLLVAHQVWSSLLGAILARLLRAREALARDGVPEPEEVMALLDDWQERVLDVWAPLLVPEVGEGQARPQLVRMMADVASTEELFIQRLPLAIQRFCDSAGRVEALGREAGQQ